MQIASKSTNDDAICMVEEERGGRGKEEREMGNEERQPPLPLKIIEFITREIYTKSFPDR
jgi:hypothetical protein